MVPARTILSVFKTIALSMVLVFVADIVIYLYKAFQLQQRIESLAVSMQRTVMQNNYLPESEYKMYTAVFKQIAQTMNGKNKSEEDKLGREKKANNFIDGNITMNYDATIGNTPAITGLTASSNISTQVNGTSYDLFNINSPKSVNLATPAQYGDLKYIQIKVTIKQPVWGFVSGGGSGREHSSANWTSNGSSRGAGLGHPTTTLCFSYFVPCLHYNAIT